MRLVERGAWAGIAALCVAVMAAVFSGNARAQETTDETVVAEPAAMSPEADEEGDPHEG